MSLDRPSAKLTQPDKLLRQHVRDCESLHADFGLLIKDLELKQAGTDVQYAVDFSEMYSYVLPDRDPGEFRIFHGDSSSTTVAVQHYVLTKLFFDLDFQRILLPPYALELKAFADYLRQRTPRDLIDKWSEVHMATQTVRLSSELPRIQKVAARLASGDGAVDAAEIERVLRFFENNAASLLRLVDQSDPQPMRRLFYLLERSGLQPLAATIPDDLPLDRAVIEEWEARLESERGGRSASNRLDAVAAATVHTANQLLRKRGQSTVLRLVTRSGYMHRVARQIATESADVRQTEYFLRHPRAFLALRRVDVGEIDQALGRLNVMQIALELVVEAYGRPGTRDDSRPIDAERRTKIKQLLNTVRGKLYGGANLASIAAVSRNDPAQAAQGGDARSRILRVFEMVNESNALRDRVEEEISSLARTVDQSQQLLAVVMCCDSRPASTAQPRSDSAAATTQLNPRLYWMPYQLDFKDAELQSWQSEFTRRVDMSLSEMLGYFQAGFGRGLDYETALCLAYLLGAWDEWQQALKYCDISLTEHGLAANAPSPRESKFFKAVTLRSIFTVTATNYEKAQMLLDEAQAERKAETGAEDPRYTLEKATLMFFWARAATRRREMDRETADRRSRAGVILCGRALEQAGDDHALRALIFNTLCVHFCEVGAATHLDEVATNLRAMERELASIKPEQWPINFVDTALVARCRLAKDRIDLSQWLRLMGILERAITSNWLRKKDVPEVRRHLREATDFLPEGVVGQLR